MMFKKKKQSSIQIDGVKVLPRKRIVYSIQLNNIKAEQLILFPITDQPHSSKLKTYYSLIDTFMSSLSYEVIMGLLTLIVLYADDVRMLVLTKNQDDIYFYFMLICFFIFTVEMVILSFVRKDYFLSFFFFMDVASTLSTVMEVPMVMTNLLGIEYFSNSRATKLARTGRASKVSSRGTKVIRVVRLIRLVRIAKLYKYGYKLITNKLAKGSRQEGGNSSQNESQVDIESEVEIGNIELEEYVPAGHLIMVPRPQSIPPTTNDIQVITKLWSQAQIQAKRDNSILIKDQKQASKSSNSSSILINHDQRQTLNIQLMKIDEQPIHYEEQLSSQSVQQRKQLPQSQLSINIGQPQQLQLYGNIKESVVGKTLSELTTKRAIMIMFSVMVSIPLLDSETYFQDLTALETGIEYLETLHQAKFKNIHNFFNITSEMYNTKLQSNSQVTFYYQINNEILIDNAEFQELRDLEIKYVQSQSGLSLMLLNQKDQINFNAILGLIRTTFVIFVLVTGALMFSKDANDIVVVQIENMLVKVKRIAQNPLDAARIEEEFAISEEQLKKKNLDKKLKNEKLQMDGFETVVLERLIIKTGALLAVGFGEAGAQIISQNMNQDGDVNPMIPGQKIFAIFGYCDIRQFNDLTEILEETIYLFVNEIAEIVHSTVYSYQGAPNRNTGSAFLLVWKFPNDALQMKGDHQKILNTSLVNNFADMSLLSFLKIMINVRNSSVLRRYTELPEVQTRLPEYSIKMGFGLHVGWAIEGAIGSIFKIDATYISPNVNLVANLTKTTKEFGVYHLVSGPFYGILSKLVQSKMRRLDRVTLQGSSPIDLFTIDLDLRQINDETLKVTPQNTNKKIQRFQNRQKRELRLEKIRKNKLNINKEFLNFEGDKSQELIENNFKERFNEVVNLYLKGNWEYARTRLEDLQNMRGLIDRPAKTLMSYMQKYNFEAPDDWKGYRALTNKG